MAATNYPELKLTGVLLVALLLGQVLGGLLAYADHAFIAGSNQVCNVNGRYYHVHWERTGGSKRSLIYKYWIVNSNGSVDYPQAITLKASQWNTPPFAPPDQEFVELVNNQQSGDPDVSIFVDQYTWEQTGLTVLVPDQCPLNANDINESTHISEGSGSGAVISINSRIIEQSSNPLHVRRWTVAHEWGHAIGLGHRDSSPETRAMYFSSAAIPEEPRDDDVNMLSSHLDPYGHAD